MPADLLTYQLENITDYIGFESLCHDLMALCGYSEIEPLGKFKDKGRDAIHVAYKKGGQKQTTIFCYSLQDDWEKKLKQDLQKIKNKGFHCDSVVFITTANIGNKRDILISYVREKYGWELEIYGLERLRVMLDGCYKKVKKRHLNLFPLEVHRSRIIDFSSNQNILFDESHSQSQWNKGEIPLIEYDYKLAQLLAQEKGFNVSTIKSWKLFKKNLKNKQILILVSPREDLFLPSEIKDILDFVRCGGGVLLLGYYCGDIHHKTNLNEITTNFGITFNYDRVVDKKNYSGSILRIICSPIGSHEIVKGVRNIYVPFPCSLEISFKGEAVLMSSKNSYIETPDLVEDGIIRSYRKSDVGPKPIAGVSTYGMGKVVVIGSWQVFTTSSMQHKDCENLRFYLNIIKWLATSYCHNK